MKFKFVLALVAALFALKTQAQPLNLEVPLWARGAGVHSKISELLEQPPQAQPRSGLTDALDQAFDAACATTPIKGINAAMQLPDGTVWKRAHGFATELPFATPLTTEHLMGMGSITKTFVSATLLTLVDEGLLALQDSIGKFLPSYPNVSGKITIRQMLSHRSGIFDYLNESPAMAAAWFAKPDSIWVTDTILKYYVLAPNFSPGASWSYSNTNYLLAEKIIEKLTGQRWYEAVRERILAPMGLTHTFAYPWETPGTQPFSHVWADFDGNGTVDDLQGSGLPMNGLFSIAGGAGCLISTPEDISKFNKLLFSGTLLQPATLAAMQTDYLQNPASGLRYGLGAYSLLGFQPYANWGHDGSLIYQSFALHFPGLGISIAVQQNDDRNDGLQTPMNDLVDVFVALFIAYTQYDPATSTEEIAASGGLQVWPNPTAGVLNVTWGNVPPKDVNYTLFNSLGQAVRAQAATVQTMAMDLSGLPKGGYYLCAQAEKGIQVRKIVLE